MDREIMDAALRNAELLRMAQDSIRNLEHALIGQHGLTARHVGSILGIARSVLGSIGLTDFMQIAVDNAEDNPS